MSTWKHLVICLFLTVGVCQKHADFPKWFRFGVGSSSYQTEGGWNASDKGESTWDRFTHEHPDLIADGTNGDVACDSYHQWRRDVEMAAELGVDFYRFSISWTRILPNGFANYISEDGKNYYNNLINVLLEKGIEPMVTIYHWDLPQILQDLGGWANPLIVEWFGDYARVVYSLYSDRVKTWLTINEPSLICDVGYSGIHFAPYVTDLDVAMFLCTKYVILAHAKAWRIYDEEFRPRHNGQISFSKHIFYYEAQAPADEDITHLAMQYLWDRYTHPIFSKEGGWPPLIEKVIAEHSDAKGYATSRLPAFTPEEIQLARGTYDFIAINQYSSRVIRRPKPGEKVGVFPLLGCEELNIALDIHPDSKPIGSLLLPYHPVSLRKCLSFLKNRYGNTPIIITENGYSLAKGQNEEEGVDFYKSYLEQVLLALYEDGVNVTAYSAWTLMDNFEWFDGYSTKFGLYQVNFTDPMRTRTPRQYAKFYGSVVKAKSLNVTDMFVQNTSAPTVTVL